MVRRRDFMKLAGAGALYSGIAPVFGRETGSSFPFPQEEKKPDLFGVGMAGYTFAR
ncbi:MAG: twin-arginine translocation signal domain-containing protein, partial [Bacteroidales bacterium]|nr:twin-arginine translocation signal domain-containing protein [Bacteroidales bacterium]